jgi:hypothetical protein
VTASRGPELLHVGYVRLIGKNLARLSTASIST